MIDLSQFVNAEDAEHTATINARKRTQEIILSAQNKIANDILAAIEQGYTVCNVEFEFPEEYWERFNPFVDVVSPFVNKGYDFVQNECKTKDGIMVWTGNAVWNWEHNWGKR